MKAKYCSQCGGAVTTEVVEDRRREVCAECGTIFYKNPLPVAASVVLNEEREVLLVKRKREPKQGMWCLPIGFAELGETISDAARRELKEEAGIESRTVRLLDTDSNESEHYGDLLVVTFEMEKTGGVEKAGDDAEAVSYFPFNWLPPLAFSSNEKAIQACIEVHRDEWAIQDSFQSLQSDEGRGLLSDALISLVQDRAKEVTALWFEDVRSNPTTPTYAKIDPERLFARGHTAISQFGRWLRGREADDEVRAFYRKLGEDRRAGGFAAHEAISSLTLLRKHVWTYARSHGIWRTSIDVYRVLELNRRIALFFDKAIYNTVRGFEEAPDPQNTPDPPNGPGAP